jgi:molecular chaperone DnaK
MREAEQFAEADRNKREEIDLRNNADSLMYTAEKTKKDLGDKITEDQKSKVDAAVAALRDSLAGTDTNKIKAASDELTKVLQEVGTAVYQQAAAQQAKQQQAPPGGESPPPGDEKVVDSEDYKVK